MPCPYGGQPEHDESREPDDDDLPLYPLAERVRKKVFDFEGLNEYLQEVELDLVPPMDLPELVPRVPVPEGPGPVPGPVPGQPVPGHPVPVRVPGTQPARAPVAQPARLGVRAPVPFQQPAARRAVDIGARRAVGWAPSSIPVLRRNYGDIARARMALAEEGTSAAMQRALQEQAPSRFPSKGRLAGAAAMAAGTAGAVFKMRRFTVPPPRMGGFGGFFFNQAAEMRRLMGAQR